MMNWTQIVKDHEGTIRQALSKYEYDPERLEDLVQDVWVRAMEQEDKFDGRAELEPWLYTIAHNIVVDHIRYRHANGRDMEVLECDSSTEDDAEQVVLEGTELATPEAWYEAEETAALIERARAPSDHHTWTVLYLTQVEGYSVPEVAQHLGVSESTVRTYLQRVREQITALLQGP